MADGGPHGKFVRLSGQAAIITGLSQGREPHGTAGPIDRAAMVAHWLDLTRRVLPAMALRAGWPIRRDHCFMRVCLDHAIGQPWHRQVRRPAIRHLTDEQLRAAIAIAERIAADPASLPALNRTSIAWRRNP